MGRDLASAFAGKRRFRGIVPLPLLALLMLSPCDAIAAAPASPQAIAVATPSFDAVAFFSGRTKGEGVLRKIFSAPQATHVVSFGKVEADGTLVLDQTVKIDGYKTLDRVWHLHEVAPGRFTGTLTGARGPVSADVVDGVLHIDYVDQDGFTFRQRLTMAPGGQSAHNVMRIKRFGLTFATVNETITRE